MLQIPRPSIHPPVSPYAKLGLKDLPFPTEPVVDPYNTDPRRNGAIYAEETVRPSLEKFQRLLIRPNDFRNRVRLAYLWSEGDLEQGRGVGKTALLRYFRQRINHDWGYTEFNGQFSALVVYVAFPSQVDRRYIEQLALSALVDICKSQVLDAARAALRMQFLQEQQVQQILTNPDNTQDFANLLNDEILRSKGIEAAQLNQAVCHRLIGEGVQRDSASALAAGTFEDYLKSFRRDNNLEPFYVPRDTKILDYSRGFLFNDAVLYLKSAGFAGGYLFIDDIENLVDQMARRHRVEFAKEFALCTVRPGYANTAHNFFSSVLTTHRQASVSLSAAWVEAGLAGIARLDPGDPNSVELPLPSTDQAKEILVAHLDYFRVDDADKGTTKPFSEDGMAAMLRRSQHPRMLLNEAALIVSKAALEGVESINAAYVNAANENPTRSYTQDFTGGIEGAE